MKKTNSKMAGKRITKQDARLELLKKADALFDLGNKANHNQRRFVDSVFRKFFNMTAREMRSEMMEGIGPNEGCSEFM